MLSSNSISTTFLFAVPTTCPRLSSIKATAFKNPNPSSNFTTISLKLSRLNLSPSPNLESLQFIAKTSRNIHRCQNSVDDNQQGENENENENENGERDWSTSILLFLLWAGLMYYVFHLTPNQTPSRDMYFLEKLLNLKGEDGFEMNQVLVSLWYIMGLWPLVYSMLLLPSGRSSKGGILVWPFLVLSCFGGAYVLLPYFVVWKPPAPRVDEAELERWPLNILESKLTAGVVIGAGLGLMAYATLSADASVWKEFYQYFRESKFIHATCVDFCLLSTFAPFWVYNDMSGRRWSDEESSLFRNVLLSLTLIPFLGPALYLVLRPPLALSTLPQTKD
ncbi:hypothetical protein ACHQM5_014147 [Ranunculus cassubicifolius]